MKFNYKGTEYKSIEACLKANNGTRGSYEYYRKQGHSRRRSLAKACKSAEEGKSKVSVIVDGKKVFDVSGNDDVAYGVMYCISNLAPVICKFVTLECKVKK